MPYRDYTLTAERPHLAQDGFWIWTLDGRCRGRWVTELEALQDRESTFAALRRRARRRGGWMWRSTGRVWHVTLPAEVPCVASPMQAAPISRHG